MPRLNVLDNVALGLRACGSKCRAPMLRWRQLVCGSGRGPRPTRWQLPGGMQQRVGIARALAGDADLLLMDRAHGRFRSCSRASAAGAGAAPGGLPRTAAARCFSSPRREEVLFLASRIIVMSPRPGASRRAWRSIGAVTCRRAGARRQVAARLIAMREQPMAAIPKPAGSCVNRHHRRSYSRAASTYPLRPLEPFSWMWPSLTRVRRRLVHFAALPAVALFAHTARARRPVEPAAWPVAGAVVAGPRCSGATVVCPRLRRR